MFTFYLSLVEDHNNDDDFERIYNKYSKMLYKVAKTHTKNHHLAEDAVQEVLIGVARNIGKIKNFDEDYLEIYLCKAAKNCAFYVLRKERQASDHITTLESISNKPAFEETISDAIVQNELLEMTLDYIQSMEEDYRDILTYYFLYHLTLREIALILHIPLSTVKTRFYKGKKMIDEKFKEYRND